jgi:hypothetical protein
MNIKVKIPNSIEKNLIVSPENGDWLLAQTGDQFFGVVLSASDVRWDIEGDDQNSVAMICFSGLCDVIAAENIPDEGGPLEIVNGQARVNAAGDSVAFILPLEHGQPSRVAGDLVQVCLR